MKYLKVISLFALPLGLAAMSYVIFDIIGTQADIFTTGVNYVPLMCAMSFFAFLAFFILTANALYPSGTIVLPIKKDTQAETLQPCYFEVIRPVYVDSKTPLFIS